MSYLGRGIDAISNVEKLTNITFDGSTTYNLVKDGVAFTPAGKNNILISINGVIQQGNFTVANATIIFDFSPTSNDTCNFIMHYGTGVLNVPADSSVNMAQLGASGTKSSSTFLAGDNSFKTISGTTINNNADNKIITGSGTANTLEGEANATFDGTQLNLGGATDAGFNPLQLGNTSDNHAYIQMLGSVSGQIHFGDATSGDAREIGAIQYRHDEDVMKFKTNGNLGLQIDVNGHVTKPLNSAFRVRQSSDTTYANNHTMYNQNITEDYDVNADMGTNGSFTAPVTGKYLFTMTLYDNASGTGDTYDMCFITSNRNYRWGQRTSYDGNTGFGGYMKLEGTIIADMDANDTAYVKYCGGQNAVNHGNQEHTYFMGILIG